VKRESPLSGANNKIQPHKYAYGNRESAIGNKFRNYKNLLIRLIITVSKTLNSIIVVMGK